ncbi:hypothetical protein D5086_011203 [Populus alba]|uniref:Heat shock family protein n=2 Tax=Populus alba TaxID=43335 RepID=A0A4V6A8N5_POPAL|nr:trichohyalin-like isoform X2 [Populus alba]TKS03656.1 heat shock family protein [Populus alba]
MELELGLKITHARDDITSFTGLRVAKDHAGPLFLSRETETVFNLIAYLTGFRKENIDIKISEDGNQITISGKKPVQELVLIGWIMHKKEVELRAFSKAFRIPHGVVLDKIKAKFSDQDLTLTITLPKLENGIRGVGVEEVKEEEVDKGRGEATQITADRAPEGESREPEMKKVEEIDQVVQKEMNTREAETTRAVALELSRKEKDNEAAKEESIEPKIRTDEETAQVREQAIDQGQFKEVEEVADHMSGERDNSKEIVEEKSAEPNIESKEESEKFVEQKVDAGDRVPERVGDTTLQRKPEPKDQSELEEATLEKSEPPATATTATYQETTIKDSKQVKPEKEIEHQEPKEPTLGEETESKELPGLKEQWKKQETPEAKSADEETLPKHPERNQLLQAFKDQVTKQPESSNQPSSQANQEHAAEENDPVRAEISQESVKLGTETNVQEPTTPGPDHKKKLADKSRNDEAQEINEATTDDVEEEHESVKVKDLGEGATNRKNSVSRGTKLFPPLVVAGSAILVSIIVLVISWIRAKKR